MQWLALRSRHICQNCDYAAQVRDTHDQPTDRAAFHYDLTCIGYRFGRSGDSHCQRRILPTIPLTLKRCARPGSRVRHPVLACETCHQRGPEPSVSTCARQVWYACLESSRPLFVHYVVRGLAMLTSARAFCTHRPWRGEREPSGRPQKDTPGHPPQGRLVQNSHLPCKSCFTPGSTLALMPLPNMCHSIDADNEYNHKRTGASSTHSRQRTPRSRTSCRGTWRRPTR